MQQEKESLARLQLAALPSAPWWATRYATDVLRRWELSSLDEVVIAVVSEMVGYAATSRPDGRDVRYAGMRGLRRIVLTLRRTAAGLGITVWCRGMPVPYPQVDVLTGRRAPALPRVDAYGARWGFVEPPCGGLTVWAELTCREIT